MSKKQLTLKGMRTAIIVPSLFFLSMIMARRFSSAFNSTVSHSVTTETVWVLHVSCLLRLDSVNICYICSIICLGNVKLPCWIANAFFRKMEIQNQRRYTHGIFRKTNRAAQRQKIDPGTISRTAECFKAIRIKVRKRTGDPGSRKDCRIEQSI